MSLEGLGLVGSAVLVSFRATRVTNWEKQCCCVSFIYLQVKNCIIILFLFARTAYFLSILQSRTDHTQQSVTDDVIHMLF